MNIIYDGECPFCSQFVKFLRIRKSLNEPVELIDARSDDPLAIAAARKYDLDEGMLVQLGGRDYYGSEAINILSLLSTKTGFFNRFIGIAFSNKKAARILYPFMKFSSNYKVRNTVAFRYFKIIKKPQQLICTTIR